MAAQRDPVSELFDDGARRLLAQAYAHPGQWRSTRLSDPGPRELAWCTAHGINPYAADDVSARGRGINAKTRWCRAFIRAAYYQHRWYSPGGTSAAWRKSRRTEPRHSGMLELEVGPRIRALGVLPAGREVKIRFTARRAEPAKDRHFRDQPAAARVYEPNGTTGARWSDPALRDW
jgi:hypothetical protein